jgi:hypothetical protein
MKNRNHFDQNGDLRDIFAAMAMQSLMKQDVATPIWVAHQAYKYADAMLDVRDAVSDNKDNNK